MLRTIAAVAMLAPALQASAAGGATAVGACAVPALRLAPGFSGAAALQFTQTLIFRNSGSRSCTLAGWPLVRLRISGRWTAPAVRVVQGGLHARPYGRVTLRPGGRASFDLYGADWDTLRDRACPRSKEARIVPPGVSAPLAVRLRLPVCGRLEVSPVVRGPSDRRAWSFVWKG